MGPFHVAGVGQFWCIGHLVPPTGSSVVLSRALTSSGTWQASDAAGFSTLRRQVPMERRLPLCSSEMEQWWGVTLRPRGGRPARAGHLLGRDRKTRCQHLRGPGQVLSSRGRTKLRSLHRHDHSQPGPPQVSRLKPPRQATQTPGTLLCFAANCPFMVPALLPHDLNAAKRRLGARSATVYSLESRGRCAIRLFLKVGKHRAYPG